MSPAVTIRVSYFPTLAHISVTIPKWTVCTDTSLYLMFIYVPQTAQILHKAMTECQVVTPVFKANNYDFMSYDWDCLL